MIGIHDALDPVSEEGLEAVEAGVVRAVAGVGRATKGVVNGVLLGVNGADAMVVHHQAAALIAVWFGRQAPVVSGARHPVLPRQHRANVQARAGGTRGDVDGHLEEVVIPRLAGRLRLGRWHYAKLRVIKSASHARWMATRLTTVRRSDFRSTPTH